MRKFKMSELLIKHATEALSKHSKEELIDRLVSRMTTVELLQTLE